MILTLLYILDKGGSYKYKQTFSYLQTFDNGSRALRSEDLCECEWAQTKDSGKMSKQQIEPPTFISETKSYETYKRDFERWCLLTSLDKVERSFTEDDYEERMESHMVIERDRFTARVSQANLLMTTKFH